MTKESRLVVVAVAFIAFAAGVIWGNYAGIAQQKDPADSQGLMMLILSCAPLLVLFTVGAMMVPGVIRERKIMRRREGSSGTERGGGRTGESDAARQ